MLVQFTHRKSMAPAFSVEVRERKKVVGEGDDFWWLRERGEEEVSK